MLILATLKILVVLLHTAFIGKYINMNRSSSQYDFKSTKRTQ